MLGLFLSATLGLDPQPPTRNVLLIIADDLGTESVNVYDEGPAHSQPPTPTMDWIARHGLRFRSAFAQPVCSVSRASVYTGLLPIRTGIGSLIGHRGSMTLPPWTHTLPERLRAEGVRCSLVGKWHLGFGDEPVPLGPIAHGWHEFQGTQGNLTNHYHYLWSSMGPRFGQERMTRYSTTQVTDVAIQRIRKLSGPWFLTVAYHAPHAPVHTPPVLLHSYGLTTDRPTQYLAMVEAFDTELGRLLDAVDLSTTTVLLVGDNGMVARHAHFVENEVPRSKGTHYEMGSRVPMMAIGAAVTREGGAVVDGLVQCTDLYDTILDLMGVPGHAQDSISFLGALSGQGVSLREDVIVQRFANEDRDPGSVPARQTARGRRFKLLWNHAGQRFNYHDLRSFRQERGPHLLYPTTLLCAGDLDSAVDYQLCRDSLPAGEPRDEFVRLWSRLESLPPLPD